MSQGARSPQQLRSSAADAAGPVSQAKAIADNRPQAAVQRAVMASVNAGPAMTAQRQALQGASGSVAQREPAPELEPPAAAVAAEPAAAAPAAAEPVAAEPAAPDPAAAAKEAGAAAAANAPDWAATIDDALIVGTYASHPLPDNFDSAAFIQGFKSAFAGPATEEAAATTAAAAATEATTETAAATTETTTDTPAATETTTAAPAAAETATEAANPLEANPVVPEPAAATPADLVTPNPLEETAQTKGMPTQLVGPEEDLPAQG